LICWGLLHCGGSVESKAEEFYNILQEGGLDTHKWISASDKDIEPIFEKMCLFATVDMFQFAEEYASISNAFEEHDEKIRAAHEDVREDHFLDEVYGKNARLENEPWLKLVSTKAKWVFDPKSLRMKVFEACNLTYDRKGNEL
jgi:hypothetical protein